MRSLTMEARKVVMNSLDTLRLGGVLRKFKRLIRHTRNAAKARLLWHWTPLVPERAFSDCAQRAIRTLTSKGHGPFGAYLEFGVSRGTSLASMYHALEREGLHEMPLYGFDSFEGMPQEALEEGWLPGDYKSTVSTTRKYLRQKSVKLERVTLVEGWFKDTLTDETVDRLDLSKASLIMIDCDIYSASRAALWFCEPLIRTSAVVFFDDWGWRSDLGEIGQKEAFEEFLAAFPSLTAEPLPAYLPQARCFLVTRRGAAEAPSRPMSMSALLMLEPMATAAGWCHSMIGAAGIVCKI